MTQSQSKRITLQDIADRCDVSAMSVSAALRGDRSIVGEQTMERIQKVAQEMGYEPATSHAARRLKYARSDKQIINHVVGIYQSLRYVDSNYFGRLLQGIGEVLDEEGFALLTNWGGRKGVPEEVPVVFRRGDVDGVLTMPGIPHTDEVLKLLRNDAGFGDRPVVNLLEPHGDNPAVLTDDREGGRLVARHLLEQGHRRILHINVGGYEHTERRKGIREVLSENGISPDDHLRPIGWDVDQPENGEALLKCLDGAPAYTAIYAANDFTAIRMVKWLRSQGIQIPQDISVIGYDDTHELHGPDGSNILTTVRTPLKEVARRGTQMLIDLIRSADKPVETITLPVELVERGSVVETQTAAGK